MAVRFVRFDRWGRNIGQLVGVTAAEWNESINGEDVVTLTASQRIDKGDRVVWCDALGVWHEHVAVLVESGEDEDQGVYWRAECENSISELFGDYIVDKRPMNKTCAEVLRAVLTEAGNRSNVTRWQVGSVTMPGTKSMTFYHKTCRECVKDVVDAWGGEMSTTIEVAGTGVTARKVNVTRRGTDRGKRFVYGHNMAGIKRTFDSSEVYTALYAYGKGEQVGDGYGRRLTMEEVGPIAENDSGTYHVANAEYVQNDRARELWGRPGASGEKAHVFAQVEFNDCEDKDELAALAIDALDALIEPVVSYEADVIDFEEAGYDFADSQLGDPVAIIDSAEGFDVRVKGRVMQTVRNLIDDNALVSLTIGNISEDFADMWASQSSSLRSLNNRSSAWDVAAFQAPSYLEQMVANFNERFEEGGVYKYESFEEGTIYSSVPLDENLKPTTTPARAFQLKGGGFRIADSVNADGTFDWTTMADGSGIIADAITSGIMNADLIQAGIIRDKTGKNFWNLETGELQMTVVPAEVGDAIKAVDVEYALGISQTVAPLTGWSTTAPAWQEDRYMWQRTKTVDISGEVSYSDPTCIQGAQGPAGAPGKDGADGTSVTIKGTFEDPSQLPGGAAEGDGYIIGGDLWVWTGSSWQDVGKIQGPQGVPGSPGANGLTTYVHFAYANNATGTDGFSVTPFTGAKYVGVRTDYVQDDSTTPSDYEWSLFKGTGVSAVVEEYYLSASQTTQTGGSWSTAQPVWSEGKYIWTRSKVTWTDGSTTYTSPVLAKAINGANETANTANETANNASTIANSINNQFTQQGIFNKLTNNGAAKGIYMQSGELYINATYLASGIITDRTGTNYWNLETGELKMNALPPGTYYGTCNTAAATPEKAVICEGFELRKGATVIVYWMQDTNTSRDEAGRVTVNVNNTGAYPLLLGNAYITGNSIAIRASRTSLITWNGTYWRMAGDDALLRANTAQRTANTAASDLSALKTQESIFNLLTANGTLKGIYMQSGELYINADYIKSGTLVADRLKNPLSTAYGVVGSITVDSWPYDGLQIYNSSGVRTGVIQFGKYSSASNKIQADISIPNEQGTLNSVFSADDRSFSVGNANVQDASHNYANLRVDYLNGLTIQFRSGSGALHRLIFNSQGLMVSNGTKDQWIYKF